MKADFQTIVLELTKVINSKEYNYSGEQFSMFSGPFGYMSPVSRPAYIKEFGRETVEAAEEAARQILAAQEEQRLSSAYHAHELVADANEQVPGFVPNMGDFVWGIDSGLKCEGGLLHAIRNCTYEEFDSHPNHKRLCRVDAVFHFEPGPFFTECIMDEQIKKTGFKGGSGSDDVDLDKITDWYQLTEEQKKTIFSKVAVVRCGNLWYLVDPEGYDYTRYCLLPQNWRTMYHEQYDKARAEIKEQREEERKQYEAEVASGDYVDSAGYRHTTGKKHKEYTDLKTLAKTMREYAKAKYPEWVFSITTEYYSGGQSLHIYMKGGPLDAPKDEDGNWHPKVEEILDDLRAEAQSYNDTDSQIETDYYCTCFYVTADLHWCDWRKTEPKAKKQAKAAGTGEQEAGVVLSANGLMLYDYSAKAFALVGNTREIKDQLKELGGRFNARLSCGAGWVFPKTKEAELKTLFA